jgi:UDP-N-acetylmuramyl pentapeptide phosphotransferase/UDP-N-acetylglucosamine-1-phosphate transferase
MEYVLLFIILVVISVVYIKFATRFNIVDNPNHRSSHTVPTIRGGGIIFYFALILFFIFSGLQYHWLIIGTTLVAIVSFIDDLKPLSPKLRFSIQIIGLVFLLMEADLDFNLFILLVILIMGIAFINAFNFMDGINGITGFYSGIVLGGYLYIDIFLIDFINEKMLIFILISILIFGFYNFRKRALFFAGDVGSVTLAMIIFLASSMFFKETNSPIVFLMLGVYGVETLLTIIRRFFLKHDITEAHREHLYQKIVDNRKISHLSLSFYYAIAQSLLFVEGLYILRLDVKLQWICVTVSFVILTICYIILFRRFREKLDFSD